MTMICLMLGPTPARDVSDRVTYFHRSAMTEIGKSKQIFGAPQYQQKSLSSVC